MRKLLLFGLVAALGVLGISAVALAGRSHDKGNAKDFSAKLNGWEEDPSQVTTGKGSFRAHVDSATQISFTLKYRDLEGPAFMAHIHIGSRHESGGVSAWLCGGTTQPACPAGQTTEAVVNGTIQADDITGPAGQGVEPGNFADLLRAVRKGETYTNVHTGSPGAGRAPNGEIRGQNKANKGHDDDDDHDGGNHKRHR
jgi:CHRD domain